MAGRSGGPPSGSRSPAPPRPGGLPATASWGRRGWPTGPAARIAARTSCRSGPSGGSSSCGLPGGWGRPGIAWALHLNPSTVHQVLRRYHCPRLAHLDRAAKIPVRRYERDRPGELIPVDVKKLGSIPDGGGHRVTGPSQGQKTGGPPPAPARTITRSWATATCIPPWMTTPAWSIPRSCPTSARTPRPRSCAACTPGTPATASPSSRSCPATAGATAPCRAGNGSPVAAWIAVMSAARCS
jgi:hypothetical protein